MTDRLSIIIPALNEASVLDRTLSSCQIAAPGAELLVVDGGSTDATLAIASRLAGVRVLRVACACRAVQCNAGARAATGSLFLFLHADTTITSEGVRELYGALQQQSVAGGCFSFALADAGGRYRLTEWGANFRSRWLRLPFGDQGIFCRSDTFTHVGGFPEIPLMDDVAFIDRLRRCGRVVLLRAPVRTSGRRIMQHGIIRSAMRNYAIVMAYRCGISPVRLARWYRQEGSHGTA
ncbi:MAG: TIGR04283 family arsenosugar biosynthesis glycosyltransferase [Deltaproteobacteria bacterium]|nr:TIGR04283 family arsenosugar biosynthesis glycosyltransferase [Deltaproteobacteria bacterium]